MRWWNFLRRKESEARSVSTFTQTGRAVATPANYEAFAKKGYGRNVTIYRCVNMIAHAGRGMKYLMYNKDKEVLEHPILKLWAKPNPMQSTADFVENLLAFYLLTGNSYVEANSGLVKSPIPLELWNVRPDKMKVIGGEKGYPKGYKFEMSGRSKEWEVDFVSMRSPILHWKTFNPLDDWYGMSPIEAALLSLDQAVAGQMWNLALLQNSATPSGVLQVKVTDSNPRGEITEEQYKRMREDFETNYQGIKNTGKPMIIEGGLSWTQMGIAPKDMEYTKGKEISSTDICLVFGIPPELMGLGQKTFNNYREARLSLYEETILPTMDSAMGAVNRFLFSPEEIDAGMRLDYDRDDIEILQWKREQRYTSLQASNFLNQNEKREAVGYEPLEGWDVFVIGNQVGALPEDFSGGTGNQDPNNGQDPQDPNNPDQNNDNGNGNDKPGSPKDPPSDNPSDGNPEDNADPSKEKAYKSINLLTPNEKRESWRAQNVRRKRLQGAFDRDLKEDYRELVSLMKKVDGHLHDPKITEFALLKIAHDFMPTMERTIKRHIRYVLEDFGREVLREGKSLGFDREQKASKQFEDFVRRYAESRSGQAISTITSTTSKNIKRIIGEWTLTAIQDGDSNAELSKFIESEFEDLTPAQATRIARTEVAIASNNGALEAVKSLQIPNMFKEWVTANDDRVRDGEHGGADHGIMNGAEVPLDEKFSVPPDASMDGPGDDSAGADQVINCRCVLTYRSKN